MFELKPISRDAVPAALEKAERYRLLNEPVGAESICLDILEVDPENQDALVTLILSLTDQFPQRANEAFSAARDLVPRLASEYQRLYYTGILFERRAQSRLEQGGPGAGVVAYDWYRQAMEHYAKAAGQRPEGEDASILRWNTCVRVLERHPELRPEHEEEGHYLLDAF
jgi:hypothetical protein